MGSSTAGHQLNGDAAAQTDGSGRWVLRVTPAATQQSVSAFSLMPFALASNASFSTSFTFNINTNDSGFIGTHPFCLRRDPRRLNEEPPVGIGGSSRLSGTTLLTTSERCAIA